MISDPLGTPLAIENMICPSCGGALTRGRLSAPGAVGFRWLKDGEATGFFGGGGVEVQSNPNDSKAWYTQHPTLEGGRCHNCGKLVIEITSEKACPRCGKLGPPNTTKCAACGIKLAEAEQGSEQ